LQNSPGGDIPTGYKPCEAPFVSPLFSQPYESLFSQLLCFHIHPKTPGVGGITVPRFDFFASELLRKKVTENAKISQTAVAV
jgi:hypothetical protein